jgi:2-octaprenyl-6-methoxyphenol hydroxylase
MTRGTTHKNSRRTAKMTHDVMIVGGGLAGGTLACLLGRAGFKVACIDREVPLTQFKEAFDGRTTAISWGSRMVLDKAGLWERIEANGCPIRTIDILDGGSPVLLRFGAEEVGNRSFGWIVENSFLRRVILEAVAKIPVIDHFAPAQIAEINRGDDQITATLKDGTKITAPLLIGADGRGSMVRDWAGIGQRGWDYKQHAVVCIINHSRPHNFIAVEHFRDQGPFAILPMNDDADGNHRSSIVWTEPGPERDSFLNVPEDVFNAGLAARCPDFYGRVALTGQRYRYPLGLSHAHDYIAERVALVGDAAHGIHPIAGQGLNLGFRDIGALYESLCAAREAQDDLGCAAVLTQYQSRRRTDTMGMVFATDTLNRLFSNRSAPFPLLRKVGLKMVARTPIAKKFFMTQAMGAAGILPDLMRGIEDAA